MKRVIRNYVSEPSFDYPADNIVYVKVSSFLFQLNAKYDTLYLCLRVLLKKSEKLNLFLKQSYPDYIANI